MRLRFVASTVGFFMATGIVLAAVFAGPGLLFRQSQVQYPEHPQATMIPEDNVIAHENSYPGTTSWQIPAGKGSTIQLQAYAGTTSVSAGQTLTFYVSTQQEGIYYTVTIYRIGWYSGLGARLMSWQGGLSGHVQGYYDSANHKLVGCGSCRIDLKTGLVEANWKPSYSLIVPTSWTTGVYLAKFTDVRGMETYVPFDVRGNFHSRYVAVTADTTYAAYNLWGGYSLYAADDAIQSGENSNSSRASVVSFGRPFAAEQGSSQVLVLEANAIHWMERQGYDLSYISSVDLHEKPAQLLQHSAYISLGHDEYWTKEMRDGVEHARDSGVGLAFLEADAGYWQMRFQPDRAGIPDRTIVCYKVQTALHDLARDPLYGKDNSRVTSLWRDPVVGRPENALIGIMFSSLTHQQPGFPWAVDSKVQSHLLDGTGLLPGQQYGCSFVGYEWDQVFANGFSPPGLRVIATSHTLNSSDEPDFSNTTYYIAASGAMVFATGSIYWTAALDSYRLHPLGLCPQQQSPVVPGMQKLMANVMDALGTHHSSL
jgi:hypothetical protein